MTHVVLLTTMTFGEATARVVLPTTTFGEATARVVLPTTMTFVKAIVIVATLPVLLPLCLAVP